MHLWNDYEGKTIANAYPLEKLVRPEGRSAFFVTANGTGTISMIRLTESLNDEPEMLERWRQVAEVHQENLVAIKTFGQTTFDGVPLAYALMEHTDADLGEILKERPLTPAETTEVGKSVVAALSALHASGLVHEHIEPSNILATGDVIKLRSDCVRECIADPEFSPLAGCEELKQRDVHDLAALLLRCLTLEKTLPTQTRLPAPFDSIVRKGIEGTWGLSEIAAALSPGVAKPAAERPLVPQSVLDQVHGGASSRAAERIPTIAPASSRPTVSAPIPDVATVSPNPPASSPTLPVRRVRQTMQPAQHGRSFWMAWVAGAVILLAILWTVTHRSTNVPRPAASIPTIEDAPGGQSSAAASSAAALPAAPVRQPAPSAAPLAAIPTPDRGEVVASATGGWRVIAYTYNHEGQAFAKAAALRKKHNSLNPEVFSPSGKAPYLVALGGVMDHAEAEALSRKARRSGLPRDTFARNYRAR